MIMFLGGLFQVWAGDRANRARRSEADTQRSWQKMMSDTAITREVADLRNAGLNPILAAGGGASTPSGGMANVRSIGEGASASAQGAVRMIADLKQIKTVTENEAAKLPGIKAQSATAEAAAFSAVNRMSAEMKHPEAYGLMDAIMSRVGLGASNRGVSISGSGRK